MSKRIYSGAAAGVLSLCMMSAAAFAADVYKTDSGHTEVRFGWSHFGVSMQHGEFTEIDGTLILDRDNVENSSIEVVIDASSINTGVEALDNDVMSARFLEVETYPEITFVSTSVTQTGDGTADITGNLTIHGVTRPIVLKTELTHIGEHPLGANFDRYKGDWVAFSAIGELEHTDFDVGSFSTGTIYLDISTELKAVE